MRKISLLFITLALLISGPVFAQDKIGKTKTVKPAAHGTVAGTLAVDSDVHAAETIHTDTGGQAGLEFMDQSKLDVGPKSSVKLDKFIYDPNRGAAAVTLSASRGSFRYVTGATGNGRYKVTTPYGTLGIRGALEIPNVVG